MSDPSATNETNATSETNAATPSFADLSLPAPLLRALDDVGYEVPTPIQLRTIGPLLEGRDVLGQAQTGTGKTAAFALPLLARIDLERRSPQVLVLTPTRELAIQVAEAFKRYAAHLPGFHVLPIYGGQGYPAQLRPLKRGVHVVVGTPGRVMDHVERGTLVLDGLTALVLDEADEMLRMGFADDVEWILERTPPERQIALFSATLPPRIQRIAERSLKDPERVAIEQRTRGAETVRQRAWIVPRHRALDALTRVLEAEPYDAAIVFVRRRSSTVELAEKLEARGHATAVLSGDVAQAERERTVERLKRGQVDVLVATDVAARGLDVARVSHVINFDAPHDVEGYVHRIGRTGRAGRTGEAILFATPRERGMLRAIERATGERLERYELPSAEEINELRLASFRQRVLDTLDSGEDLSDFERLVDAIIAGATRDNGGAAENGEDGEDDGNGSDAVPLDARRVAAALARLAHGEQPLLLDDEPAAAPTSSRANSRANPRTEPRTDPRTERPGESQGELRGEPRPDSRQAPPRPAGGFTRHRIQVGHRNRLRPGDLVGSLTRGAGLDAADIGRIDIRQDHCTVELRADLSAEVLERIEAQTVRGRELRLVPDPPNAPRRGQGGQVSGGQGGQGGGGPRPHRKGGNAPARTADHG